MKDWDSPGNLKDGVVDSKLLQAEVQDRGKPLERDAKNMSTPAVQSLLSEPDLQKCDLDTFWGFVWLFIPPMLYVMSIICRLGGNLVSEWLTISAAPHPSPRFML